VGSAEGCPPGLGNLGSRVGVAGAPSSTVTGASDVVFAALADAFEAAASQGCVLVATVSNACPI
jgi:hypothetical protein